ncbi:hypothetical protein LJC59_07885, partial [Desulfovibrio sp. OttesenSCG-928-A18]|nr:hypothetical protein [Desulfovibrio sp. OttesenSCG-928-A18]
AGLEARGDPRQAHEDEDFRARSLALLREKADEEIRLCARRIFLATALSQNGRLDALIVFVSLCRLVWRVSRIYNQRPHPSEVLSLYWAVVSSTFLALSIEELDIATEISVGFGEAFHAMAPAGMTASIPFAGKALQTFTSAVIDGTANCYLALRAGIIVRNAYAYGAIGEKRPGRAAVFREAGAVLLDMSRSLAENIAASLASNFADAARNAGEKTLQAGKELVSGIGRAGVATGSAVSTAAGKLGSGAASAVQEAGKGLCRAGAATGSSVGAAAGKVATGTVRTAQGVGKSIAGAGKRTGRAVGGAVKKSARLGKEILLFPLRPFRGKKDKD